VLQQPPPCLQHSRQSEQQLYALRVPTATRVVVLERPSPREQPLWLLHLQRRWQQPRFSALLEVVLLLLHRQRQPRSSAAVEVGPACLVAGLLVVMRAVLSVAACSVMAGPLQEVAAVLVGSAVALPWILQLGRRRHCRRHS